MSGICGVVALDGTRASAEEVRGLLEPLGQRGPDGSAVWLGGQAALGHALLATTPESLAEPMPLAIADMGCAISADARLDNRESLIANLGLEDIGRIVGDGELILRAYRQWGEFCVDHLLGDFAFALWDESAARLFCARDQMGMRQLTYCHLPGRRFLFTTEPEAILEHEESPRCLNEGRIADFLDGLEANAVNETFFEGVSRLPAAHCLTLDDRGLRIRRYWQLELPPELILESDSSYQQAFLEVFTEAVRCRLRSPDQVGAMLSGGMDSSAVAAVAAQVLAGDGRGPLATFSAIGPDPANCVETRAALAAAGSIEGIDPHFVSHAGIDSDRETLLALTMSESSPFDGQMALHRALYLQARHQGVKVMLDGAGGDMVMGPHSHVERLLRRGRILAAAREARAESMYWGQAWPLWKAFGQAAFRAFVPRSLRILRRRIAWWLDDRAIGRKGLVSSQFAERSKLRVRRQAIRRRDRDFDRLDRYERVRRIDHAKTIVGRERYERVASAFAIEPRDPFLDLRVIGFALSLPADQLQKKGWPKILLRRAMAAKLADEVRWRRSKEHLGAAFTRTLVGELDVSGEEVREVLMPFVDEDSAWLDERYPTEGERCLSWLNAVCLYFWLTRLPVRAPPGVRTDL